VDDTHDLGPMTPISMLLLPATLASLDAAAAREGRSRSNMARRLVELGLGENSARAGSVMAEAQ
jgi:hypothetical protein